MYKNIVKFIEYALKHTNNDPETADGKNVHVKVIENENRRDGAVQVDIISPWVKTFHIQSLNQEVLRQTKINLKIFHGDHLLDCFVVYTATYDKTHDIMVVNLHGEGKAFIEESRYYLSFYIEIKRNLRGLALKLRDYIKNAAPSYPTTRISFTESDTFKTMNDMKEKCFRMISEGIGDVIKHSTSAEFCSEMLNLLQVQTNDTAVKKIYELTRDVWKE